MAPYNFKEIEKKWQDNWTREKSFISPEPTLEHPAYFIKLVKISNQLRRREQIIVIE